MRADQIGITAVLLLGTTGLYFLLAGEVSGNEALAGLPIIVVVALYAVALRRHATLAFRLQPRAMRSVVAALGAVGPDMLRVGVALGRAVLGRAVAGREVRQPFRFGEVDPTDAGRRAVVVAALSLAPNGFVVEAADEDALLLHQLAPAATSGNAEWPV